MSREPKPDITISPAQVVALGSMGNQARLNNGCVCNGGCESCARLDETFEAMREALDAILQHPHVRAYFPYDPKDPAFTAAAAALKLAEGVKRG